MACPLAYLPLLWLCLLLPLLLSLPGAAPALLTFAPNTTALREETTTSFQVLCQGCPAASGLRLTNKEPHIAVLSSGGEEQGPGGLLELQLDPGARDWNITVNVTGTFLGFSQVEAALQGGEGEADSPFLITVKRSQAKKTASKIFGYSVAVLVSLAYINFGAALDLGTVREVLRRPVGPAIGFVSQFLFMPLCSFLLGYVFPHSSPEMRLGLFVTGTSPGGGASNIWTVMFGGNLDLSVTMTAVSTFSAFFMMPLWVFLLGEVIIADTQIVIPYFKITTYAVMLVVPLLIGVSIRKCLPKAANVLVRVMKPLAFFLIIFILVCGIWSQFFMIKLITWRIAVVGFGLPWLGFGFGCITSKLLGRERKDIIAIAIETGVQNTGMSIFMLWYALDHPAGDLAAVVPVAVATLTPLPLLAALGYYRARAAYCPLPGAEPATSASCNQLVGEKPALEGDEAIKS